MAAPAATKAAIERALGAAIAQGLTVSGFAVARDGTITVTTGPAGTTRSELDESAQDVQSRRPRAWTT